MRARLPRARETVVMEVHVIGAADLLHGFERNCPRRTKQPATIDYRADIKNSSHRGIRSGRSGRCVSIA